MGHGRSSIQSEFAFFLHHFLEGLNYSSLTTEKTSIMDNKEENCFALLLSSTPIWLPVKCEEPLSSGTFCYFEKTITEYGDVVSSDRRLCPTGSILKNYTCFHFIWHNSFKFVCNGTGMTNVNIDQFKFLFNAVCPVFPPIVLPATVGSRKGMRYNKVFSKFQMNTFILHKNMSALHICSSEKHPIDPEYSVFQCQEMAFISVKFICNDVADCPSPDDVDERGCTCNNTAHISNKCKHSINESGSKACSIFYYLSQDQICHPYISIPEAATTQMPGRNKDTHRDNKILKMASETKSAEQSSTNAVTERNHHCTTFECQQQGQIPCGTCPEKCFSISAICLFRTSKFAGLEPCGNGAHLQDCK